MNVISLKILAGTAMVVNGTSRHSRHRNILDAIGVRADIDQLLPDNLDLRVRAVVPYLILVGQHDCDHAFSDRRVGWVWGMISVASVVIIDLEEDRFPFGFERSEVMFFMRIICVAEIVVHSDRLHNALDSLLAQYRNARRHYGQTTNQMLAQFIIERANAFGPGIHG